MDCIGLSLASYRTELLDSWNARRVAIEKLVTRSSSSGPTLIPISHLLCATRQFFRLLTHRAAPGSPTGDTGVQVVLPGILHSHHQGGPTGAFSAAGSPIGDTADGATGTSPSPCAYVYRLLCSRVYILCIVLLVPLGCPCLPVSGS